jgi:hypothetical protein
LSTVAPTAAGSTSPTTVMTARPGWKYVPWKDTTSSRVIA